MFALTRIKNVAIASAAVLALSGALAACGDDATDATADPSAGRTAENGDVFNGADVQFATDMIPHHAQAIEMVALTQGRVLDPEVAAIAAESRGAQEPENQTMTTWLTDWANSSHPTMRSCRSLRPSSTSQRSPAPKPCAPRFAHH